MDIAEAALGAAKKAAKDTKSSINATVDAAGSSTATTTTDVHGDKIVKSDSSTSDIAQDAAPPADPSARQDLPVAPQLVAVGVSAPLIAVAPSRNDGATGQDADHIAALGDAVKAGAPGEKADRAGAEVAKSGAATADSQVGGSTKAGTKTADAVTSMPLRTSRPTQKDQVSSARQGQANAADGARSAKADVVPAAEAAANHARQRAVTGQPSDATAGLQTSSGNSDVDPNTDPNVDSNVDSKPDPAGSAKRIEEIARKALDTTAWHIEAPAAETVGGGTSHPASVQADGTQQSPDGPVAPAILTTSAAAAAAPTTTAAPAAIPITGLAVEIASRAHAGKNRFEIRLDPPELGRIDVRLDVDREGKVTSRLVVDRPETLDILRRDAPELERSLQQAGLKTADNALQFSLRDHGGFGSQNPYSNSGSLAGATRVIIPDRELPPVDAAAAGHGRAIGTVTGVDIRV
jgi:flagellar hook-length control protein FliK